jgi:regulator of cell morphogenesis and NO signaling
MGSEKSNNSINFSEMRIDKLVDYLSNTHDVSVKSAISRFNVYLKTIIKVDSDLHPEVKQISLLIHELITLIDQHLIMEEHLLFPYVAALVKNQGLMSGSKENLAENPIKKIKTEHSRATEILALIRKVSNNYLPAVNSSPALKLCYAQLFDFEQDIHRHIFLEEKILFPKLLEMEKRNIDQSKMPGTEVKQK